MRSAGNYANIVFRYKILIFLNLKTITYIHTRYKIEFFIRNIS